MADFNQIPSEFYYKNVYPTNDNRVKWGKRVVRKDLQPFLSYLQNSRNNLQQAASVKADCFEVKPRLILKPRFSLLKLKALNSVTIKKPDGFFYVVDWNEDWGDIDDFEAIAQRRTTIFESQELLDIYNGKMLFKSEKEIDCSQTYRIFFRNSDEDEKCIIRAINFNNFEDFRAECVSASISSVSENKDYLSVFYNGTQPKTITLFNCLDCDVVSSDKVDMSIDLFSIDGVKLHFWKEYGYLVAEEQVEDELPLLFYDGQEVEYTIIDKEQLAKIINDPRIQYVDKKLTILDPAIGDVGDKIEYSELPFEVLSLGEKIKRQYFKYGSCIVELNEDDSFQNDIYSNVSYFFRETTERVVDENGKKYQIGMKYETYNQIEIVLLDDKGRTKLPVTVIPKQLTIEPNDRQIKMQLNAVRDLINKPSKEHAPLLELMENKRFCEWASCNYGMIQIPEKGWYKLTNPSYEGCSKQREFVKKALATPDFAILEGPPGSGKTTTILEIIAQMIMGGQKVILAASTNAAIDNILERLDSLPPIVTDKIIAVRIGNENAISDSVDDYKTTNLGPFYNTIMERSNLVCGTIIGILQHPLFKLGDKSQPVVPLYDCLIIDEASKTTFQEFLVPAIYAKKWVLSGDLKQLTPYIDQDNIEASLTQIEGFNSFDQQAQAYLMLIDKEVYRKKDDQSRKVKFGFLVDKKVIDSLTKITSDYSFRRVGAIGRSSYPYSVSKEDFIAGKNGLYIYGADVLFIDKTIYSDVMQFLPSDVVIVNNGKIDYSDYQNNGRFASFESNMLNTKSKSIMAFKEAVLRLVKEKTWAGEIAWRLCRIQELFMLKDIESSEQDVTDRYQKDIMNRIPTYAKNQVMSAINILREIALPSVLQLLQKGIDSSVVENTKETTLNGGFEDAVLRDRHSLVEYQHRMHSDISAFSAKEIYQGEALFNGSIIDRKWSYKRYAKRAVWLQIDSIKSCSNSNIVEVDAIYKEISAFVQFAREHKKPDGSLWSIACLTYYRKQEKELKDKIKKLFNDEKSRNYYKDNDANIELMIYTVDKFQGKEADVVFLSMIKSGAVNLGFMDSPNRLNVALTRAKYQIVLVGDKNYFRSNNCKSQLLQKVAEVY